MDEKIWMKKIIFLGTSSFAANILEGLLEKSVPISWVVSQPDRPAGRKKIPKAPAVKILAQQKNIPLKQFEKLDQTALDFFKKEQPDLLLVAAYGKILPQKILDIPLLGAVNVHGSLLPQYRGASPIQTALLDGQTQTGVSLILMNAQMDAGPIITQEKVSVTADELYPQLEKKLAQKAIEILPKIIAKWLNKEITPLEQTEKLATYCHLIKKIDGQIDWNQPAEKIYNRFRAFSVWPNIYSFWQKKPDQKLKITIFPKSFSPDNDQSQALPNGKVFLTKNKTLAIKAQTGFLEIAQLQLEGKKILTAETFLLGQKDFLLATLKK